MNHSITDKWVWLENGITIKGETILIDKNGLIIQWENGRKLSYSHNHKEFGLRIHKDHQYYRELKINQLLNN